MYIMQGLPASGKSTRAQEIVTRTGNTVRINRDLIRKMLHFDKWTGRNEGHTKDASRKVADWFLSQNINVIIDDTNLNAGTLQSWKDLAKIHGASVEIVRMETSIEECIRRNTDRGGGVGEHVIIGMALQNGLYPAPARGIVIVDIDGTLADCSHRQHHVQGEKKDWKAFFAGMSEDMPRIDVIETVIGYFNEGHEIFIVSGRPDDYRTETSRWLHYRVFHDKLYKALIMRRAHDSRPDDIVKQEIYDTYFKGKYPVHMVIDDRPSVIRMWRSNGLPVTDVGNGVEF